MNERIKELALQAWMAERTEKDPKYKKSEVTEYLLKDMEDFHKKFAELIVNKCANIVWDEAEKIDSHEVNAAGYKVIEHFFGVEE